MLLGVPPTLPALHRSLGLSYSAAGLLTSLPVLGMALGAVPAAFVISRLGVRTAVATGLALLATGALLRGILPQTVPLFGFTVLLAAGVALAQTAVPSLVQRWFPDRIGRATAIYSNGLLVGETIAATITLPLLLGALKLGWQGGLAAWAIPVFLCFGLWLKLAPAGGRPDAGGQWMPDLRSGPTWRLGLLMGGASLIYFGMNTWVPDTLDARGRHDLIPLTLGLLNGMQLPMSFILAALGDRLLGRRWPFVLAGLISLGALVAYGLGPVEGAPIWAGLLGAVSSGVFILNLGLPALLAPREVARVSGFMFTLGYGTAFFGPALGGIGWDLSGYFELALLPIGVAALGLVGVGFSLPRYPRPV